MSNDETESRTATGERYYDMEEPRQETPLAKRQPEPQRQEQRQQQTPARPGQVESRVRQTPEATDLMIAFAGAQREFPPVIKARVAEVTGKANYTYNYASLADVQGVIYPILAKHGLAFMTIPTRGVLVGRLIHQSTGQWIEGDLGIVPPDTRGGVQALGSAITYERRYLFAAMLGLVLDDDDDGRAAVEGARDAQGGRR